MRCSWQDVGQCLGQPHTALRPSKMPSREVVHTHMHTLKDTEQEQPLLPIQSVPGAHVDEHEILLQGEQRDLSNAEELP